ncbi:hypothetical protein JCM3775_001084 [Rhodotorula graminis]|uniref:PARP catalytic domain-containing protein n=1 Tax=Rhodotorula graminis (strain WP1) TaxID=578459 RepID=A0A194S2S2_RHOGW|nr:uncharacterized protein RHOBADRAFT_53743 [Rhodotorula graminis WP1]KPV74805.1 hypothetical protein RHOBADRAFT_53743 [Rhodotorula graminis WP1]
MPPAPSRKRQKTELPTSAYPNTRSASSNPAPLAPPPPAADTAMHRGDSDQGYGGDDDDDEPFEYDSDYAGDNDPDVMVLDSPASAPAGTRDSDRDDDKDGDDEGEDQLESDSDSDRPVETLVLSDLDDAPPPEPRGGGGGPAPTSTKGKGKLTARKQFALDVQQVHDRFAAEDKALVKNFKRDEGDDAVRFALEHPKFPRGLRISLLFPELGGYPLGHEVVAFTEHEEVPDEVSVALQEVSQLPKQADRSLNGLVEFLVHRIVQGEPNPWTNQPEADEDEYAYEDELENLEVSMAKDSELFKTLRADFKQLIDAGYRPGFTRLSELDLVVSVAKKVNLLDVPARALQAWDSKLITGHVVYLVLLINFGPNYPVDLDNQTTGQCRFKVGVSPRYKPVRAAVAAAFRAHSSNPYTKDEFEAISLSAPLDALLNDKLGEILHVRRSNERIGWAGAEQHCFEAGRSDDKAVDRKLARAADKAELEVSQTLPPDPMASLATAHNFPLLAFSYLIRRFVMCPRFCLNCYKRCDQVITALKPFVCESPLCLFQLIALGLGPSLEHEITTNSASVDLLVQLTYIAAKENGLKGDLLPVGLELKVPKDLTGNFETPIVSAAGVPATTMATTTVEQETVDLDTLGDDFSKCGGVAHLINELPPISEMRVWLLGEDMTADERLLNRTRKLVDMRGGTISISAWRLLRWIVASNTSYLKLIEEEDELIQGIGKDCRQFRLVVGSPAKEHLLAESVKTAQIEDANAQRYPTLFAFHGSSVKNWSSILRQGLHFRETINGRAYGHGVYFAKDGSVSLGHYAAPATTVWKNAEYHVSKLAAICEITNLPAKFVSSNPYFVVNQLDWIQARYLIAQASSATAQVQVAEAAASASAASKKKSKGDALKTISLDPKHPLTIGSTKLIIPDVGDKLAKLEASLTDKVEELNVSDSELLEEPPIVVGESGASSQSAGAGKGGLRTKLRRGTSSLGGSGLLSPTMGATKGKSAAKGKERAVVAPPAPKEEPDTFEPADAARLALVKQIPPPSKPSRGAMAMIQKEMRAMLKAQKDLGPTSAGFFFDPERSDDNAFNWVIELPRESFEEDLPLRKDMDARDVKSILMEIRFGDTFPFSPPFFRVVHPRFLPFAHGGGGHVTAGGSICMDESLLPRSSSSSRAREPDPDLLVPATVHLLTTDGWSSVYTIEAILLQIRMAMSNLEPKPARLDQGKQWNQPYSMEEAIAGFRRAAQTHGWQVPAELDTFAAQG